MNIFKYQIGNAATHVEMPAGARVLCAKPKDGGVYLWVLADPKAPFVTRVFEVMATGYSTVPKGSTYVDTYFEGSFVWHVFEMAT